MSLARNVVTVAGATLTSRLLGFVREMAIAALLGAGALSDSYFAALQIPNLFRRLLAEGALNSAFVPVWLRKRAEQGGDGARRFSEEVTASMLLGLGALTVLAIVFAPQIIHWLAPGFADDGQRSGLAAFFLRLSASYMIVAGLVAVGTAILSARGRAGAVAYGIVIFNAVFLAILLGIVAGGADASPHTGAILAAAIVVSGLCQLIVVGIALARLEAPLLRLRFAVSNDTRRFFARALPGLVAASIPQLTLIAGAIVASHSQAAVSWLYYAYRLYELPLGVISIAAAAVLTPLIAASLRINEKSAFAAAQSRAYEIVIGLALPAAIGLFLLAEPITRVLFERGAFTARDTAAVAGALAAVAVGLPGHALEKVLGSISFAHEDTRTPMFAALSGLTGAVFGSILLFPDHGHVGIAIAIAGAGWVGAAILGMILAQRRWLRLDGTALHRLPRMLLAALGMLAAIVVLRSLASTWLAPPTTTLAGAAHLAAVIVAGVAIYLTALHVLGAGRIRDWIDALRDKA